MRRPGTYVAGVGMHPFGRFPDRTLRDLGGTAVLAALDDAGIEPKAVDAAFVANSLGGALTGQQMIRGQTVLRDVGINGIPVVNVENACAGGSTALYEAVTAVRAGRARCALALGVEKMYVGDRGATLKALESAGDVAVVGGLGLQFTAVYAMRLRERIDRGELELRHLVDMTIKNHRHGVSNPYAQFRQEVTAEQVSNSPRIADPLTLLMCSAIGDGAAAAVVVPDRSALPSGRVAVEVRASQLRMGAIGSAVGAPVATVCAEAAYAEAGTGPQDIDVFEVHDAMAPGELVYYEDLGLCAKGGAGALLDSGATALGGRTPVNPSGGLSARGHPVAATGLAQIAELVWQLRGEAGERQVAGARIGLAQNSGGWLEGEAAACAVHVLQATP